MIEGLVRISRLITHYAIFECIYLQGEYQAKKELEFAMVRLSEAILVYLLKAEQYYSQGTMKRAVKSIGQGSTSGIDHLIAAIDERERHVGRWSTLIRQEGQIKVSETAQRMENLLESLQRPILRVSDQILDLHDDLSKDRRRKLLQWLSRVPYRQHQRGALKDVLPGSGQWLLESSSFCEWLHSSFSSLLWLHGIPGSGKTKLTSIAIQHLVNQSKSFSSPAPIAYFYCVRNPAEPERSDPDEIVNALLKQLTSTTVDEPIPQLIVNEYQKRSDDAGDDGLDPIRLDIWDCSRLTLELFDRLPATIFIDALDECDPRKRHKLFRFLAEILEKANNIVKIFVTSRDDNDLVQEFGSFSNIRIAAKDNNEDIKRFVAQQLQVAIKNRTLLHGHVSEELQQHITRTLVDGAQGMCVTRRFSS